MTVRIALMVRTVRSQNDDDCRRVGLHEAVKDILGFDICSLIAWGMKLLEIDLVPEAVEEHFRCQPKNFKIFTGMKKI